MRMYRSAAPETGHEKLNQPPLVGPGWPAVKGLPLEEVDLTKRPLAQPPAVPGLMHSMDKFPVYLMASALCFTMGRTHRLFTLGAVLFGSLAVWKAWREWRTK
jgi:hypothetical protein